jgi:hypothetical protein
MFEAEIKERERIYFLSFLLPFPPSDEFGLPNRTLIKIEPLFKEKRF